MKPLDVVGLYFHVYNSHGNVNRQGRVRGEILRGMSYLVQWYSWLDGQPTTIQIVAMTEMSQWKFYLTPAEWVAAVQEQQA